MDIPHLPCSCWRDAERELLLLISATPLYAARSCHRASRCRPAARHEDVPDGPRRQIHVSAA